MIDVVRLEKSLSFILSERHKVKVSVKLKEEEVKNESRKIQDRRQGQIVRSHA